MQNNDNELLAYVWGLYRVYAITSRKLKSKITTYRFIVIFLTILAAVSGVLCLQLPDLKIYSLSIFGFLSALSFSFAAYFSKEIIKSDREQKHVIARSAAEALKSESYLYATSAAPYNTPDVDTQFFEKSKNIRKNTDDILLMNLADEQKKNGLVSKPMSVESYIEERVQDQIKKYYYPSSQKNGKIINRWEWHYFYVQFSGYRTGCHRNPMWDDRSSAAVGTGSFNLLLAIRRKRSSNDTLLVAASSTEIGDPGRRTFKRK